MGEAPLDSPEQPILKSPPLSSTSVRLPSSTLFKNRSSIFSGKTANYFDFSSDEEDSIFSQHQLNKKPVVNNVKPEIYRKMFSSNDDKPAPKRHQSLSSFSRAIGNLFDSSDEEDIVAPKRSFIKKEPIIKQEPMDYSPEIKSSSIFSRTSKLFDFSDDDDDDDMATVRKKPVFINPLELSDSEDEAPIKKLKSKQKTKSTDLPAIFSDVYLPKPKAKLPKQDPSEFSDIEEMPMEDYRNIDNYGRTIDIDRRKGNHITITKQKRLLYESESDSDTDQQKLGIYQSRSVYRPISDKTKHPTEQQISLSKLLQEKKRRPLHRFNPFILFNTKTRRKLAQENPTLTVHELSHLVAQAWRGLDSVKKIHICT
ncbi:uncharacterized protein B0P05DRAFT_194798 [Gilbertella persicaria]|uniref:uncharacterized protein n=1 Tax=Gilbertella persicaria TaxID=101096 RepID=UPI00221EDDF4|nr:uncharacterized protein B0P05DRAFT_194798 [Gilbertella persicaria]KAI8069085.1 hypothetical protein B0P05DRAFT_194798 [Gilbertella persicaria]